jgi:hypothetical protein
VSETITIKIKRIQCVSILQHSFLAILIALSIINYYLYKYLNIFLDTLIKLSYNELNK